MWELAFVHLTCVDSLVHRDQLLPVPSGTEWNGMDIAHITQLLGGTLL